FFSSRRRHTRFSRDWSSDVCSSDLHATECLQHDIVSGLFAPGAVASVPRYFTINQAGVDLAQALVVDTESLRRTGAETLYDHIGARHQLTNDLLAFRRLQIQRKAPLVVVDGHERSRFTVFLRQPAARLVAGAGRLHFNDVGAKVAKILSA